MKQWAALLIPHFCASEPEALGSCRTALLIPHYHGEAAGCIMPVATDKFTATVVPSLVFPPNKQHHA